MATRRAALGQIALGLGVLACRRALAQPAEHAAYVGVETSARTGLSRARFFTASGAPGGTTVLDFRAHGLAGHDRSLVVFPRRPGNRFAVVDLRTLEILQVVTAPPDRHFYGHGAFTVDGRHLLVTENNLDTLAGGIGVYEVASGIRRLGEIGLDGAGPHEIVRDPHQNRFHIALGGLETHPDYGRRPLNLRDFRSQIVTLDFDRDQIEAMGHWAGTEGVSLRHLAVDAQGRVLVGGQLVDKASGTRNQILWLCDNAQATALDDGGALAGYVSSVACHGQDALVTSKEANAAIRLSGGRIVGRETCEGASAAALGPQMTALSGYGKLRIAGLSVAASPGHEFDNHGVSLL